MIQPAQALPLPAWVYDGDDRAEGVRTSTTLAKRDALRERIVDATRKAREGAVPGDRNRVPLAGQDVPLLVVERELVLGEVRTQPIPVDVRDVAVVNELWPRIADLIQPVLEIGTLGEREDDHRMSRQNVRGCGTYGISRVPATSVP